MSSEILEIFIAMASDNGLEWDMLSVATSTPAQSSDGLKDGKSPSGKSSPDAKEAEAKKRARPGSSARSGSSAGGREKIMNICAMPRCDLDVKRGSKWCPLHNCHYENLRYEKEHNKKDGSKENKEAFVKRCKEDIKMLYRMLEVSPTKKCCVSFGSVRRTVT